MGSEMNLQPSTWNTSTCVNINSETDLALHTQPERRPVNTNSEKVHQNNLPRTSLAAEDATAMAVGAQGTGSHKKEAVQTLGSRLVDLTTADEEPRSEAEHLEKHEEANLGAISATTRSSATTSYAFLPNGRGNWDEGHLLPQTLLSNGKSDASVSQAGPRSGPVLQSVCVSSSINESSARHMKGTEPPSDGGSYQRDFVEPEPQSHSLTQAKAREPEPVPVASATGGPEADAGSGLQRGAASAPTTFGSSWNVAHVTELVRALCLPSLSPPARPEFLDRLVHELVLLRTRLEVIHMSSIPMAASERFAQLPAFNKERLQAPLAQLPRPQLTSSPLLSLTRLPNSPFEGRPLSSKASIATTVLHLEAPALSAHPATEYRPQYPPLHRIEEIGRAPANESNASVLSVSVGEATTTLEDMPRETCLLSFPPANGANRTSSSSVPQASPLLSGVSSTLQPTGILQPPPNFGNAGQYSSGTRHWVSSVSHLNEEQRRVNLQSAQAPSEIKWMLNRPQNVSLPVAGTGVLLRSSPAPAPEGDARWTREKYVFAPGDEARRLSMPTPFSLSAPTPGPLLRSALQTREPDMAAAATGLQLLRFAQPAQLVALTPAALPGGGGTIVIPSQPQRVISTAHSGRQLMMALERTRRRISQTPVPTSRAFYQHYRRNGDTGPTRSVPPHRRAAAVPQMHNETVHVSVSSITSVSDDQNSPTASVEHAIPSNAASLTPQSSDSVYGYKYTDSAIASSSPCVASGFSNGASGSPQEKNVVIFKEKEKQPHVKRPMNAFMVWAHAERARLQQKSPHLHNKAISRLLGVLTPAREKWRALSRSEKEPYFAEQRRLQTQLIKQHPDYKYHPRPRRPKGTNRVKQSLVQINGAGALDVSHQFSGAAAASTCIQSLPYPKLDYPSSESGLVTGATTIVTPLLLTGPTSSNALSTTSTTPSSFLTSITSIMSSTLAITTPQHSSALTATAPPAKRFLLNELKPGPAPSGTGKDSPLELLPSSTYRGSENHVPATSEANCTSASLASFRQEDTQVTRIADERPSMPSSPAFGENGTPVEPVTPIDPVGMSWRTPSTEATRLLVRDSSGWRTGEQLSSSRIDGEQVEQDLYYVERDAGEEDDPRTNSSEDPLLGKTIYLE